MNELEVLNKVKEALIFEGAWLYESSDLSEEEKGDMLEYLKVIWNRTFQRAGFAEHIKVLLISEENFLNIVEKVWGSNEEKIFLMEDLKKND